MLSKNVVKDPEFREISSDYYFNNITTNSPALETTQIILINFLFLT